MMLYIIEGLGEIIAMHDFKNGTSNKLDLPHKLILLISQDLSALIITQIKHLKAFFQWINEKINLICM